MRLPRRRGVHRGRASRCPCATDAIDAIVDRRAFLEQCAVRARPAVGNPMRNAVGIHRVTKSAYRTSCSWVRPGGRSPIAARRERRGVEPVVREDFGVAAAGRDVREAERHHSPPDAGARERSRDHHALAKRHVLVVERDDERKRPSASVTHSSSMRLSHGRSTTAALTPSVASSSAARHALRQQQRPVPDEGHVDAGAQRRRRGPTSQRVGLPGASTASSSGTLTNRRYVLSVVLLDGPADGQTRFALVARLDGRQARNGADRRDVAHRLMRVTGTSGNDTGERADVDDLRPLGRVVVNLLVRASCQEAGERVDDRQHAAAAPCRRRPTPCAARQCRTR